MKLFIYSLSHIISTQGPSIKYLPGVDSCIHVCMKVCNMQPASVQPYRWIYIHIYHPSSLTWWRQIELYKLWPLVEINIVRYLSLIFIGCWRANRIYCVFVRYVFMILVAMIPVSHSVTQRHVSSLIAIAIFEAYILVLMHSHCEGHHLGCT